MRQRLRWLLLLAPLALLGLTDSDTVVVTAVASNAAACSNLLDDDGDGLIDFPTDGKPYQLTGDDGCWDPTDDDERAGVPAGTTLVTTGECASGTLTIAGNTYNNCNFSGGIAVMAPNITVENSIIHGQVYFSSASNFMEIANTFTLRDSDQTLTAQQIAEKLLDSNAYDAGQVGDYPNDGRLGQWTYDRVRIYGGFGRPIYTQGGNFLNSVVRDVCLPDGPHNEVAMIYGTEPFRSENSWFMLDFLGKDGRPGPAECFPGGTSGAVRGYVHGTFWPPLAQKSLRYTRIQQEDNIYYDMGGFACHSNEGPPLPYNMHIENVVLVGAQLGCPTCLPKFSQNSWRNSVTDEPLNSWVNVRAGIAQTTTSLNGTLISEPATACGPYVP